MEQLREYEPPIVGFTTVSIVNPDTTSIGSNKNTRRSTTEHMV
jgi:hypothetical protein